VKAPEQRAHEEGRGTASRPGQKVLTADIEVASINHQQLAADTSDAYIWFYSVLGVILGNLETGNLLRYQLRIEQTTTNSP